VFQRRADPAAYRPGPVGLQGSRYEDELRRITVDVEDSPENQQFFAAFKQRLLERFEQIEIYIVSYPVDIL
jgi:hypothetical protein